MSNESLRDRIADILADTYSPGGRGVQFEDVVAAQAIIDDLGLEVVSDGGRPEWKLQIVGKWEKQ